MDAEDPVGGRRDGATRSEAGGAVGSSTTSPTSKSPASKPGSDWIEAVFSSLIVSFLMALLFLWDPLHLERAGEDAVHRAWERAWAPSHISGRTGQKLVRVLYIDEHTGEALRRTPPPGAGPSKATQPPEFDPLTAKFDAEMIEDVMEAGKAPPRAIFLDFPMPEGAKTDCLRRVVAAATKAVELNPPPDRQVENEAKNTSKAKTETDTCPEGSIATSAKRGGGPAWNEVGACTDSPLVEIACIQAWGGVPILLAVTRPRIGEESVEFDKIAIRTPVAVSSEAYPLQYHGGHAISPALGLFAAYCMKESRGCGVKAFQDAHNQAEALHARAIGRGPFDREAGLDRPVDGLGDFGQDLVIAWRSGLDPETAKIWSRISGGPPNCGPWAIADRSNPRDDDRDPAAPTVGWRQRVWRALDRVIGFEERVDFQCPHIPSFPFSVLASSSTALTSNDVDGMVADKIVLLGGHFEDSKDWFETPVFPHITGIDLHAMATENLLRLGVAYPHKVIRLEKAFIVFFAVFLLKLLTEWVEFRSLGQKIPGDEYSKKSINFKFYGWLYTALLFLIFAFAFLFAMYIFHAESSFIGDLIIVAMAVIFISLDNFIEKLVKYFMSKSYIDRQSVEEFEISESSVDVEEFIVSVSRSGEMRSEMEGGYVASKFVFLYRVVCNGVLSIRDRIPERKG
jgi:hypothetical protein